ncbi:MAG: hypothetical protein ACR2NN_01840 [Bryobacteraceae bacterium]
MASLSKLAAVPVFLAASLPGFCGDWNPRLATDYLDSRQKEWAAWPPAKASTGTCLSCHTGATYLFARPALRRALGEGGPTPYETGLLGGLRARVDQRESRSAASIGVESVLAALFLESEQAFDRMWSLQNREGPAKGAWAWFNLKLDPWEMPESQFYGAAMAALATGTAPAEYRNRPEIRDHIADLTAYLKRELRNQPLHNRLALLWAATKLPEALPESMRQPILDEVWRTQQADGGWTVEALGPWKKQPAAASATGSNSYPTAFVAFVLEKAGVACTDKRLGRALDWLRSHQDPERGYWSAESMNKVFEPGSMQAGFMRDAATSFAALALLQAEEARPHFATVD